MITFGNKIFLCIFVLIYNKCNEMMEIWNEFCSYLIDCKERNVSEERYHEIIESQLSVLGWKRYKGEICHKERIPSGHGFAEPDIIIKKDGVNQMVIEVKKPSHQQTREERLQLLSYMRLCMLRVGIYIGEHIEVFYDAQGESTEPVSAYVIPLEIDNEKGEKLVELIIRDKFDKDRIVVFCENKIRELQNQKTLNIVRNELISGSYENVISDCIKRYLLGKDGNIFSEQQIEEMLSSLQFMVVAKDTVPPETSTVIPMSVFSETVYERNGRDNTRYSLDGSDFLPKKRFALAVVRKYVQLHPDKTLEELLKVFPHHWRSGTGVICETSQISPKQLQDGRYHTKPTEVLCSADGHQFAVTTQWNINTIQNMVNFAKSQGWEVKPNK